jgi:RND family efflux transporter MFP subunit
MKKLKYIIIGLIIISVAGLAWSTYFGKPKTEYTTVKAIKGDLLQTVSETGTVKTAEQTDLNFVGTGKITKINCKIGDKVKAGAVLAEIDSSALLLNERQARASVNLANANLQKLLNGASASDISVARAGVKQAEVAYQNARLSGDRTSASVAASVAQAKKTYDDLANPANTASNNKRDPIVNALEDKITAAKTAIDMIERTIADENAKDVLSIQDGSRLILTKSSLVTAKTLLPAAESSLAAAKTLKSDDNLDKGVSDALGLLNEVYHSLNYCYAALQNTITSAKLTQTSLDSLKTNISAQLTLTTAGISAVQTASQNLKDASASAANTLETTQFSADQQKTVAASQTDAAYNAWQVAKAQLDKLNSPARSEDIVALQAQVAQAQGSLDSISNQLGNNLIKAPIDGLITESNYRVGETVNPAKNVFAMLSKNNYEIEVDISETDINKIKVGNKSEVTFDAFGEDSIFTGEVTFIEPAQTVIQDVIYYKTTVDKLVFPQIDGKPAAWDIKPGMTANITITTAEKKGVMIIPQRAVIEKEDKTKIVRVLQNSQPVEKAVTLGLRGDNGLVEVISGLNENDETITSIKNAVLK